MERSADHKLARNAFGSDRAQLGLKPGGTLAHISEVQRGLACGCLCPACRATLVARLKDDHQIPHFAHHGSEACGGGPETAMHLLAKEAFRSNPKIVLPKRLGLDKRKRVFTKPEQEIETQFLRLEYTAPKSIIPDLYVSALGHDLFVEIAVTHFSDEAKIQRLRKHGIPAVEVNLSRLPRDSTREAITVAVLRTAPRRWLYHPGIDAAEAQRKLDEAEWRAALEKRHVNAQAQHDRRVTDLVHAYRAAPIHTVFDEVPRLREVQEVGLASYVGIDVAGSACFDVPPLAWQTRVLAEVFHDGCLGNAQCKAVPITQHLERSGIIRQPFKYVARNVADDAAMLEPKFAPPWKAVDTYLCHLADAGVLMKHGHAMTLESNFAELWNARTLAEKQRTDVLQAAAQAVDWILAQLPANERGRMSAESWLDSIHAESGMTYRAALQTDMEAPKIVGEIDAVVHMLEKRGPLPWGTAGLPVGATIERRKAQIAKHAEQIQEMHAQEAKLLRISRRDRLCIDAEKELSGSDLPSFLNTKRDDLSGMTPLESAEDSEPGLSRARRVLSDLVRQQASEAEAYAERKRYQEKITADAHRSLPPEHVDAFLNGRDDDLGRTTPLLFAKDDRSYRQALKKLSEWRHEFGGRV